MNINVEGNLGDEKQIQSLGLKAYCKWDDAFIEDGEGVLVLGEGTDGKVKVDLNHLPHILISGYAASGKTVMESCIAWQLIKKGCKIIPIDFTYAVELGSFKPFSKVLIKPDEVIEVLAHLVKEHEARLVEFKRIGVNNFAQYNEIADKDKKLTRVILLIDEMDELMARTGSKSEDKWIETIQDQLCTLGRVSKTTGINMVASTQRPNPEVLPNKLKNNFSIRLCTRTFDVTESIMMLGSPDAVVIPSDIKGRFKMNAGSNINDLQGYDFRSTSLIAGEYGNGCLLIDELR